MTAIEKERLKFKTQIENKIELKTLIGQKQVSNEFLPTVHMAIDALALACTFRRPREFGKKKRLMNCDDFICIANNVTIEQIAVCVNALKAAERKGSVGNPTWYILGVFALY